MARVIGGLFGLALASLLVSISAAILIGTSLGGVVSAIVAFLGLGVGTWIATAVFTVVVATVFAYIIAALATAPAIPGAAVAALPPSPVEGVASGFITGLTAGVNFGVWALILPVAGIVIGSIVGLICALSLIPPVSRNGAFQFVLGWTSWLMPMSWLATAIGVLLFVVNLPFALTALGPGAVRLDVTTGTIETTGGIVGVTGFTGGGFNLGNFTFLSPTGGVGLGIQTPFTVPGLSAHETGHTLTAASFGGVFHWLNAIDENVPPLRRLRSAHGELVSESHLPRAFPILHIRVWS